MLLALILSVFAMTAIVAVRYLAVSGAFAALTARVRPGYHDSLGPQIRREIGWSLASAAIPSRAKGKSLGVRIDACP
mgnify:CR=1 FL=1